MNARRATSQSDWAVPDASDHCPQCGENGVSTREYTQVFIYGSGESSTDLSAELPVRHCADCDFQYLDSAAEDIKHRAVCRHLGVLPPEEIVRIRKQLGLSRAAFAQLTQIGEASLSRWEKGINIQSPADDRNIRFWNTLKNVV